MADVELIISANGCKDNTYEYLNQVAYQFNSIGFSKHLKVVWSDNPLGYAGATNEGIKICTTNKIVLLNNDTILLDQEKNYWLNLLESPFLLKAKCGISGPVKHYSPEAAHDFMIFFCVMIDRNVFDKIGLLNTEYGQGGGEDTEFCIEAERAGFQSVECIPKFDQKGNLHIGGFPIYHAGEKTVHDETLTPGYYDTFKRNQLILAQKYNPEYLARLQ